MTLKSKANSVFSVALVLSSVGYSAGFGLPSLLAGLWALGNKISISKSLFPSLWLFVTWVFFTDSLGLIYLLAYCIGLFILSVSMRVAVAANFFKNIFWFQTLLFFTVGLLFDYGDGAWSAGGYSIANDFCLQLFLIQFCLRNDHNVVGNMIRWIVVLSVAILNSAEIVIIISILTMFALSKKKIIFLGFIMLGVALLFLNQILSVYYLLADFVISALNGECYGSKCFRIFALGLGFHEFVSSYFIGLSPGGMGAILTGARDQGAGIVMAGSMHNIFLEYIVDTGISGLVALLLAMSHRKVSFYRAGVILGALFASGGSILYAGFIYFLIGQAVRKT